MTYEPINEGNKQQWIEFLKNVKADLEGKPETKTNNIFSTNEGDTATAKDIAGAFLATLLNEKVEIK